MKSVINKIVITKQNSSFLISIIDKLKQSGVRQVEFILPFKMRKSDKVPSLMEAALDIAMAKKYARNKGIEVLSGYCLMSNPYLPKNRSFFDIGKAKLKIDVKRHQDKPKFSIIIPAYNKKNSLKFVLSSFFSQSYPKSKYEVIVVDDGSNDKTLYSIKKILPTCNFKYFYWPRGKIKLRDSHKKWAKFYNRAGLARNIGINHAQGEIILFNDADILVNKDCLKKHKKYHDKYPNMVVRGFRNYLAENFKPSFQKICDFAYLNKISYPERTRQGVKQLCREYNLIGARCGRVVTANLSIRKKYLEQVNGFSSDFVFWGFEDTDLGYRLSKLKMKLIWDSKLKVYHLYHAKESGKELKNLLNLWVNANIFYRKYLDEKICNIFKDEILYCLDDIILN